MISFEEARSIALARLGPGRPLDESATIEKPYGWYFAGLLKTIGGGGFIVERADGRVFQFGSAYPLDRWIANYERGFKYHRYDLTISAVSDPETAVELLDRLDMQYVVPEEDGGTVWVIPRPYTREQLPELLGRIPCTFYNQAFWHRVDVFDEIDASGCCTYELREHAPEAGSGRTRRYT